MRKALIRVATIAVLAIAPFYAAVAADITVTQSWARATPAPGGAGAAYMTISNAAGSADQLVKASSPVANVAQLHTHRMDGSVMRMEPVPAVDVPANGSVTLAPGGLHVMLLGLKEPLAEGTTFPLTLSFAKAGDVTVTVAVLGPSAMTPAMPSGEMPGTGMPKMGTHSDQHPAH